jgi:hypothetical protein
MPRAFVRTTWVVSGAGNGTPTFFINGKRYEGTFKSEAFVAALLNESRGVHR